MNDLMLITLPDVVMSVCFCIINSQHSDDENHMYHFMQIKKD